MDYIITSNGLANTNAKPTLYIWTLYTTIDGLHFSKVVLDCMKERR